MLGFGKGEVGSSILLGSTISSLNLWNKILPIPLVRSNQRRRSVMQDKMQNNQQNPKPDANRQDKMNKDKNMGKEGGSCGC
jgi:hypothetical protein